MNTYNRRDATRLLINRLRSAAANRWKLVDLGIWDQRWKIRKEVLRLTISAIDIDLERGYVNEIEKHLRVLPQLCCFQTKTTLQVWRERQRNSGRDSQLNRKVFFKSRRLPKMAKNESRKCLGGKSFTRTHRKSCCARVSTLFRLPCLYFLIDKIGSNFQPIILVSRSPQQ